MRRRRLPSKRKNIIDTLKNVCKIERKRFSLRKSPTFRDTYEVTFKKPKDRARARNCLWNEGFTAGRLPKPRKKTLVVS